MRRKKKCTRDTNEKDEGKFYLWLFFALLIFVAPCFRDNHDHVVYSDVDFRLNVNFKEAFGTREVQYWKYKERKGQIRYDNTPSIFDAYRAHGVINDEVRRIQFSNGRKKIGLTTKRQRVVSVARQVIVLLHRVAGVGVRICLLYVTNLVILL